MTLRSAPKRPAKRTIPPRGRIRRSLLRFLGATVLGLGLYGIAAVYGGPWLVERWLAAYRASAPGREVSIEAVRFNPFTLVAEAEALEALDAVTGATLGADRVVIDFAASTLAERRLVISSVSIDRPRLSFASLADLTAFARGVREVLPGQARIERLDIRNGRLAAGVDADRRVEFSRLELSLTAFDGRSGDGGDFRLAAVTAGGGDITVDGSLAATLDRADGRLRLAAMDLGAVASRLGGTFGTVSPRGRADIAAAFGASSLLRRPTLTLSDARLDFSDLSLTPGADLTVTVARTSATAVLQVAAEAGGLGLSGRVEGHDARVSVHDARATPPQSFLLDDAAWLAAAGDEGVSLVLGGRLRQAGEAALSVLVQPAGGAHRVSIEVAGLPAAPLSAYAADAVGHRLTSGSADLDLEYSLNGNLADGSLQMSVRELAFAERGPGDALAADEPSLELAAALLENSDGVIELDLRFAGNSGSVREALADALAARIRTLTATPFDALATLLDDAAQSAGAVPFLPGDAALNDRAIASVAVLAEALGVRPRLGIRVHGGYDATIDRDALARQQIERHVRLATADPDARAGAVPVDFGSPRVQDVLDEFAGERLPADRVAALVERFDCEGALARACKGVYYERVFDALAADEEISQTALNRLGRFRAQSVVDELRQRGIAAERIELVAGSNVVETGSGIGLPVELTAFDTDR